MRHKLAQVVAAMQGGSCVHGGLLAHVGVAEGILVAKGTCLLATGTGEQAKVRGYKPEEGIVAVVVNNEKTGAWSYLDQVYTGLEVEVQDNILGLLGEGGIHHSLVVVAVVAVAGVA